MNEETLNMSLRKFLKVVGVTSQQEIEKAIRAAVADGRLKGNETINAQMVLTIGKIGLDHKVDGQIELSGGEGRGEQWLAEGMAEWVAFSTLEHLGLDTLEHRRQAAMAGIRSRMTLLQGKLDLEARGTPQGFTAWHMQEGSIPVYQLAFLMTDYLVERRGFEVIRTYFASFRRAGDRRKNFDAAFGESLTDFEANVLVRLKTASAL